ncbi:MAG TPA: hypothetical protein VKR32_14420 [Puia sp.]|nr:hypothetical protein [Puia sp.]
MTGKRLRLFITRFYPDSNNFNYWGEGGTGGMNLNSTSGFSDSTYNSSYLSFNTGIIDMESYGNNYSMPWSGWYDAGLYGGLSEIGSQKAFLTLFANDSGNDSLDNTTGLNLYSTWMSLNEPLIQLPFFVNNANEDSVLVTDSLGYIHQKALVDIFANSLIFDNGLTQDGNEVYLGGTTYTNLMSLQFIPPDEDPAFVQPGMPYEDDFFQWDPGDGFTIWGQGGYLDSVNNTAYSYVSSTSPAFGTGAYRSSADGSNFESSQIYGYASPGNSYLDLTVQDTTNLSGNNGIQILPTYIDLNTPSVALPYYLNDATEDSVLVTDQSGYLHQKAASDFFAGGSGSYVFDNGLTQNGSEVYAGGTDYYDNYALSFNPGDYPGEFAYFQYESTSGADDLFIGTGVETDSTYAYGQLIIAAGGDNLFDLYSYNVPNDSTYLQVDIDGSTGSEGAVIAMTVVDPLNQAYNGISLFSNWMLLNEPSVQLPYFLNDQNQDSVLATDQNGYLHQIAIQSLGNSRWTLSGSNLYDTLDYVGIGTANPQSLLAVAGTVTAQKVKVTQSGWPDYVFDSAYGLLPIADLEKYLDINKHLPDMPSAADVETNGVDLGSNSAALLKKIEELTLYVIRQNRQLELLKSQNKKLEDQNTKMELLQNEIEQLKKMIQVKN